MSYIHLSTEHLVTKHTASSRISFNGANFSANNYYSDAIIFQTSSGWEAMHTRLVLAPRRGVLHFLTRQNSSLRHATPHKMAHVREITGAMTQVMTSRIAEGQAGGHTGERRKSAACVPLC